MNGKSNYTAGALVLGKSLRDVKTKHDIIVMVTPDITKESRDALKNIYDSVVEVPYYIRRQVSDLSTKNQENLYGHFKTYSFTKWRLLGFTRYSKVCFLDADMLFLKNADHLFQMSTPAAVWSCPWAEPYQKPEKFMQPMINVYYGLKHGDEVPRALIDNQLNVSRQERNKHKTFIATGGLTLLTPSKEDEKGIYEALSRFEGKFGDINCCSGLEEQLIVWYYGQCTDRVWYHIHQKYNFVAGKYSWLEGEEPYTYHYHGKHKPWIKSENGGKDGFRVNRQANYLTLSTSETVPRVGYIWPDLLPWYQIADRLNIDV